MPNIEYSALERKRGHNRMLGEQNPAGIHLRHWMVRFMNTKQDKSTDVQGFNTKDSVGAQSQPIYNAPLFFAKIKIPS